MNLCGGFTQIIVQKIKKLVFDTHFNETNPG